MSMSIVMLITKIFEGVSAKTGHIIASSDNAGKKELFFITYMSSLLLAIGSSIWVYQYSGVFISLWLGSSYLISESTLTLMVIAMFFQVMRISSNMMKQAGGIIDLDKHVPIIESVVVFFLSIILTITYGVDGIFIAKIITSVLLSNWIKPYYIFKYILFVDFRSYIWLYLFSLIISIFVFLLVDILTKETGFNVDGWVDLILISLGYFFSTILVFIVFYYFRVKNYD
jgi:hypothetical protein